MAPFFLFEQFLDYLVSEKRFSEHTVMAYRKDIEQFIEFADLNLEEELKEVNQRLIRGWMVDLLDHDYSENSVNRKLSSLKTFFKWLKKVEFIEDNPMRLVKGPKAKKQLPSFVQQKEMTPTRLDDLFDDDFNGIRDRLMFEFLYQTGVRASELRELKDQDVQMDRIKVLGKRNKERFIPISRELFKMVEEYRKLRLDLAVKTGHFFVLNDGKKLYPKFVYRKINSYLGKATDMKKKSPHVLRHTFATHMLNNGAGLEVLKELLGHANLSATQIYTHNSFAELTQIYSRSHPRGQQKK